MRLLLTGSAGFIGHHLVEGVIKETDWDIVCLDRLSYAGNLNRLADIELWQGSHYAKLFESDQAFRIKIVYHDLRAPISETTHKAIGDIDYVWHLAAESHVEKSLEDSIPFIESNVLGTAHLLEYVRKYQPNLLKFVCFSTDEVFGPAPEGVYYKEGDVCNPSNPYSASKEGAEAISKSFAFSHKIPVMITRTMNVISERQHPEKFIPKTIKAILEGKKVIIHGTPGNISSRCWIHARNVGDALIFLMDKGEIIEKRFQDDPSHGIYHIVGEERNVEELAQKISQIIKKPYKPEYVNFHHTRPGHDLRYALSGEKLKKLGFQYKLTLDQSFEKMVYWMIDEKHKKWLE